MRKDEPWLGVSRIIKRKPWARKSRKREPKQPKEENLRGVTLQTAKIVYYNEEDGGRDKTCVLQ